MSFVAAAFGVAVAVTARTFVGSGSAGAGVTSGAFLAFGTFVFDSASGGAEIALGAFEYHIFAELAFESAVVHVEFLRGREAYLVEVVVVIAIVDDVFTSGATMAECALAIGRGGGRPSSVGALCLALANS